MYCTKCGILPALFYPWIIGYFSIIRHTIHTGLFALPFLSHVLTSYFHINCDYIKIFDLFPTETIKFLWLPNFLHLEKLSICFNICIPRLKKPHPVTPKKIMIEYPVIEVTLRHCWQWHSGLHNILQITYLCCWHRCIIDQL